MDRCLTYTCILFLLLLSGRNECAGNKSVSENSCIGNYSALEDALLRNKENVVRLEEKFFRTNRQNSIIVNVTYCFPTENSVIEQNSGTELESNHSCEFEDSRNVTCSTYRWVVSPINLYIRPELLKYLSLFTYQVETASTYLCIDRPLCSYKPLTANKNPNPMEICNRTAEDKNGPKHLLNDLTTNLRSYALHGTSISSSGSGVNIINEKGYSAYFFQPSSPSGYCVIDYVMNYYDQRYYLHAAEILLMFFSMVTIPLVLIMLYDTLRYKLDKSNSMKYFVWGAVLTSAFLDILILICDWMVIIKQGLLHPSSFSDIWVYFIIALIMLVIVPLGDFFILLFGMWYLSRQKQQPCPVLKQHPLTLPIQQQQLLLLILKQLQTDQPNADDNQSLQAIEAAINQEHQQIQRTNNEQCLEQQDNDKSPIQDFPIPTLILLFAGVIPWPCCPCCSKYDDNEPNRRQMLTMYAVQLLGAFFVVFFLQLLLFHSIYILFGVIVSPVETSSLIGFYASFIFCFIAFMAIFLKSTDNSDCKEPDLEGENNGCCTCNLTCFSKWFRLCILPVFTSFIFVAFAVCFILFFYCFSLLVQEYRSYGGMLGFLGALLPSIITGIAGAIGSRIVLCISKRSRGGRGPQGAGGTGGGPQEAGGGGLRGAGGGRGTSETTDQEPNENTSLLSQTHTTQYT